MFLRSGAVPIVLFLLALAGFFLILRETPGRWRVSVVPQSGKPVLLLWVEAIHTHLSARPASRPSPDPVDLVRSTRVIHATRLDRYREGSGRQLLIVLRIYDHDRLLAAFTDLLAEGTLAAALPLRRSLPFAASGRFNDMFLQLVPPELTLDRVTDDDGIDLRVGGMDIRLEPGGSWARAALAGRPEPIVFANGRPAVLEQFRAIELALDRGRPLALLRLQNLGWWRFLLEGAGS